MEDGLGKRAIISLSMTVKDGGKDYEPGELNMTVFESGAIAFSDEYDGIIYLYPEQVAAMKVVLGMRETGSLKFQ